MSQNLQFKTALDDSAFSRGLREMEKDAARSTANVSASFTKAGSAIGGALAGIGLTAFIKSVVDFGGALTDQADAIGMNIETMQGFQGALEQAGVNSEKFTKGMVNLNQVVQEARDGSETARASFERLGIGWDSIANDSPDEMLLKIAEALKTATNPGEAFAAALDLVGKKNYAMVAALKQGRDSFMEQSNAVAKMSADQAANLDRAGDAVSRFATFLKVKASESLNNWTDLLGITKVDTSKTDAVTKDLEEQIAAKEKAAQMRKDAEKIFGFVPAETEDFIKNNVDIAKPGKAATPEDPRAAKARAEAEKSAVGTESQMGGEAKKFLDEKKRNEEAIGKAAQEVANMKRAMYLDSISGEAKLAALGQDRAKLEREYLTAGPLRKLEIEKEVMNVRKDQMREVDKLKGAEADAAREKMRGAEEAQRAIQKTKEDALGTAQAQTSQAASNLRAVLDGKGPKKKSSKEKRLDRMVNAVMSGRQVSFTRSGSGKALRELQAAQANEKNARASLEQTNALLGEIKKGIIGN